MSVNDQGLVVEPVAFFNCSEAAQRVRLFATDQVRGL